MTQPIMQQQPPVDAERISAAMGAFCASYAWDYFFTGTADDEDRRGRRRQRPVTELELRGEVTRFVRRLDSSAQRPVAYVIAFQNVHGAHGHVHALLGECGHLSVDRVRSAWKAGRSDVDPYAASRGGAYYVPRFAGVDPDQIELSATMPPRLHSSPDDILCASSDSAEAAAMLELVASGARVDEDRRAVRPVPVTVVRSLDVIAPDAWEQWGAHMARIILRRDGRAA